MSAVNGGPGSVLPARGLGLQPNAAASQQKGGGVGDVLGKAREGALGQAAADISRLPGAAVMQTVNAAASAVATVAGAVENIRAMVKGDASPAALAAGIAQGINSTINAGAGFAAQVEQSIGQAFQTVQGPAQSSAGQRQQR